VAAAVESRIGTAEKSMTYAFGCSPIRSRAAPTAAAAPKKNAPDKAFNTLPAAVLAADPAQDGGRRVIFLSGNDTGANSEIANLVEQLGFAPITLGKLAEGGLLQQFGGPLMIQNLVKQS
jgi:predicted dinucleotide-binding enzyme